MIGIENVNEYYTNHYVDAVLAGDVRPFVQRMQEQAGGDDEGGDEAGRQTPWRRLGALQRELFAARERLGRRRAARERVELHRGIAGALLEALGYEVEPSHRGIPGGWLPVLGAHARGDGAPLLWIVPVAAEGAAEAGDGAGAGDLLGRTLLAEQHGIDAEPPEDLDVKALRGRTVEELVTAAFGLEEPPRFVLVVGETEWVLADRHKWPEQRMLRFDWAELLGRRDRETLQVVAALLHREALVPASGTALLDALDESSHRHAYGVSEDLKYALRECIERIGNEAIWYRRNVSKKGVFKAEIDGQELAIECIRYMYRVLFLLYVEARPELGYAPMGEPAYREGYSLERLRELEVVELDSEEERGGYYVHECLQRLFEMVYEGTEAVKGQTTLRYQREEGEDGDGAASMYHTFSLVPLRSHLFDPSKTPLLSAVRLRNGVLLEVIKAMSLSRPGGASGGKSKRRGRISYATLGINQLGEVYEALLSFRGFFAEETLYEVKPAKVARPDPIRDVAYFVPERDLKQYAKDERVFDENGEVKAYGKGTFIYRMAGRDREKSASYYTPEVLTKCLVKYALKELLEDEEGRPKFGKAEELLRLTICEPAMGSAAFLNEAINQIAERYLQARQQELGERIRHERYMEELQRVRMYLADNCVYGVDLNPVAVELAEVSLWLNAIFAEETKGGREVFVPWFGGQLACGNSLVGAWRKVFAGSELQAGKKGDEAPWLDAVPERVPLGTERKKGSVHHFLLPDRGMATYGQGTEGKPIREGWKAELGRIEAWRKEVCRPLGKEDVKALQGLAEAVDRLWGKHAELLRGVRVRTTDPLSVYGHEHPLAGKGATTTEEKDRIWRKEMESEQVRASSPYRRLKLAMDYWCALWFWPIEKAGLLPDREEWLADLAMLLEPGVLPGLEGGGDQRELFAETMAADEARTLVEEVGFADVEKVIARSERLGLVDEIARRYRFLHWELEFADVFGERGGFDLILGNPPWVRVEWKEAGVLGDQDPSFMLKRLSASETAKRRGKMLKGSGVGSSFLAAHEEATGTQRFLSSRVCYAILSGVKVNLYKAFLPTSWALSSSRGVTGLIHPDTIYDDPKGGPTRRDAYQRLRRHYAFMNEHCLFTGIDHHAQFALNIYGPIRETPRFIHISNLFTPSTIDECHNQALDPTNATVPGIKNDNNEWETRGHSKRVLSIDEHGLALFAKLYDEQETSALEARLPALHTQDFLSPLRSFASAAKTLDSIPTGFKWAHLWEEARAQKEGIIERNIGFPPNIGEWVLSGPHFTVGTPFYKCPKPQVANNSDYSPIDLLDLPANYLPRSIYRPSLEWSKYRDLAPKAPWTSSNETTVLDYYRVVVNNMVDPRTERSLRPAVIPPGAGHIHSVNSYALADPKDIASVAGAWMTLPVDFFIKTTGSSHFHPNIARRLPIAHGHESLFHRRVAMMVCLTHDYADFWRQCFEPDWHKDTLALGAPGADADLLPCLTPDWDPLFAIRTAQARRATLVELDVLMSLALGIRLSELLSIYHIQFPVLRHYESDTWYDRNGRIVFTNSRGLTGVGIPRSKSAAYPTGPYWSDVQHLSEEAGYTGSETITQVVTDDTLPGGPRKKTITYQAPWVRCNREHDYEVVWQHFEERFGKQGKR